MGSPVAKKETTHAASAGSESRCRRSRSVVGNFLASLQTLFGGNITIYSELCELARQDAYRIMVDHARVLGANAVIAMRYDATEIMPGVTEVLAYGTAVRVEASQAAYR